MAELFLLGRQVSQIVLVGRDLERDPLDDPHTVAFDCGTLTGVVGDQPHLANAQLRQDLGPDAVITLVRRKSEPVVRLDGIETLLVMNRVGAHLVLEADSSPFLPHVEHDTASRLVDHLHCGTQLLTTIAAQGPCLLYTSPSPRD